MSRTIVIPGHAGNACAWLALTLRLADHARRLGLTVDAIRSSRSRCSAHSRYLHLRDRRRRLWIVRVSNHASRAVTSYAKPHFDLMTADARAGENHAQAFIGKVAAEAVAWIDPATTVRGCKLKRKG